MEQTVIDNEFAVLKYYPKKKIVCHRLKKFFCGEPLQELLNKGTEILAQNGATKWLSDDREYSALSQEDLDWGMNDWTPRTIKAGWKYWAVVMPKKVVGQMSTKMLIERFSEFGVEVKAFTDPDEAMSWLESK